MKLINKVRQRKGYRERKKTEYAVVDREREIEILD
jgi:hypothetical protein